MKLKFSNNPKYANFAPRVMAALVDGAVFSLVLTVIFYTTTLGINIENMFTRLLYFVSFGLLPTVIISPIYTIWTTSNYGKTLGKALLGLEVTDKSGQFLKTDISLFRELFAKVVNGATLGLSYLSILFDPNHQGWHDQIAGTFVHQKTKNRIWIGLVALIALYTATGLLVALSIPNLSSLIESIRG